MTIDRTFTLAIKPRQEDVSKLLIYMEIRNFSPIAAKSAGKIDNVETMLPPAGPGQSPASPIFAVSFFGKPDPRSKVLSSSFHTHWSVENDTGENPNYGSCGGWASGLPADWCVTTGNRHGKLRRPSK